MVEVKFPVHTVGIGAQEGALLDFVPRRRAEFKTIIFKVGLSFP
jgi:hypothetical protein